MAVQVKYGIDFGTTNSSISLMERGDGKGKPTLFHVDKYQPVQIIRSAVAYKDGNVYVGDDGLEFVDGDEDNPVLRVKMDLVHAKKDIAVSRVAGKDLLISDVMAEILRKLKEQADQQKRRGTNPVGAVMGVPYGTTEAEKGVYLTALCKAGFYSSIKVAAELTDFMEEPVAVALFHGGIPSKKDRYSLIFDFGGGTLDLAVVLLHAKSDDAHPHQVLAKGGRQGAGERFTKLLFQQVFFPAYRDECCSGSDLQVARAFRALGCHSRTPEGIWHELTQSGLGWKFIHSLETAKAELSRSESMMFSYHDENNHISFDRVILRRSSFEQAISAELGEISYLIQELLSSERCRNAGINAESLDQVILAGGSSAIPCVQQMLRAMFGEKICFDPNWVGVYPVNALTSIAQGLAIAGYKSLISDITSFDYGIYDHENQRMVPVIKKNTVIAETDRYNFTRDGFPPASPYKRRIKQIDMLSSNGFEVDIYEGQRKVFTLVFDQRMHSGIYSIYFRIDSHREILEVHIYDEMEQVWIDDLPLQVRSFPIHRNSA